MNLLTAPDMLRAVCQEQRLHYQVGATSGILGILVFLCILDILVLLCILMGSLDGLVREQLVQFQKSFDDTEESEDGWMDKRFYIKFKHDIYDLKISFQYIL